MLKLVWCAVRFLALILESVEEPNKMSDINGVNTCVIDFAKS